MANVDDRLEFVGNAAPTKLTGAGLSLSGEAFTVADATNYPTGTIGSFILVINRGGSTEEKVLCSGRVGTGFTVTDRGYDGTVPATHDPNETVEVCWPATEADKSNLHRNSTSGVHGVAGNVVGTSDAQTLTNKTVSGTANTFSNIPETAVTGLVAALQTLTGSESTDAANIVANASAITTLQGQVAALSSPLLAHVDYDPAGATIHNGNSTLTAISTSSATISFTVPSSGKVLIRVGGYIEGYAGTSIGCGWLNHTGGAQVGRTQIAAKAGSIAVAADARFSCAQTLTGLAAGATLQLDFAMYSSVSANPGTIADLTIEAWTA